ncbi:Tigger transposable element-derived protein 1-like 101 [Homarus americanus]|uniref:Tigger transposable element-derived protein 1-like 101 n=1 Tax=Homarus americanus TaxID=6706 RepID=A0A8J5NC36_HOMAM|nr:Tigger transposable element-derived protein 1-like 101 [Homarus americanus]
MPARRRMSQAEQQRRRQRRRRYNGSVECCNVGGGVGGCVCKRNKITNINIGGEEASADRAAASDFPPFLREIMEEGQYTDDQLQKECITVLFTTNASGTCKLKLSVIHTARKPHAYKNTDVTKLNVHWLTAHKAWMFSALSLSWFDDCFVPNVKKFCEQQNVPFNILVLLNNAPGHSPLLLRRHPNVKVVFLPPNTTSLIQPMARTTIRHAWRHSTCDCGSGLAREAAQGVTAAGFSETTNDDIMEVKRDPEVTADEMLEDDCVSEETGGASSREEHKLTHGNVKDAIECAEKLKLILSNDPDHNHYEVFHNINTSHRRNITDFFACNPPQPAHASDSDSDGDFEGFVREALTTMVDSDGDSPEGQ